MSGCVHIVGAGVAGLAAAHAAAAAGWTVRLYEATGRAGGRCAGLDAGDGTRLDNGTHVLLGASRRALRFLDVIGAREGWVEPEPDGLPMLDLATRLSSNVAVSPWQWARRSRRPAGLVVSEVLRAGRLLTAMRRRSVASAVGPGALTRSVIEPLTLAALNTSLEAADVRWLRPVLWRLLMPSAGRLLVARSGLEADLVDPALTALEAQGVSPQCRCRLRAIRGDADTVSRLVLDDREVEIGASDRVILAVPPHAVVKLLPDLALPTSYEAIVNAHLPIPYAGPIRFLGVLGGMVQWVLIRPGMLSVTISAARHLVDVPAAELRERMWPELTQVAAAFDIPLPAGHAACRVVKERRATLRHDVDLPAAPPARQRRNLWLAGDWMTPLPATIEAAVTSGTAAARAIGRPTSIRPRSSTDARARAA